MNATKGERLMYAGWAVVMITAICVLMWQLHVEHTLYWEKMDRYNNSAVRTYAVGYLLLGPDGSKEPGFIQLVRADSPGRACIAYVRELDSRSAGSPGPWVWPRKSMGKKERTNIARTAPDRLVIVETETRETWEEGDDWHGAYGRWVAYDSAGAFHPPSWDGVDWNREMSVADQAVRKYK